VSGIPHSLVQQRSNVRYQKLADIDVPKVIVPSPPAGYVRLPTPIIVEGSNIVLSNPSPVAIGSVELYLNAPYGRFLTGIANLLPGQTTMVGPIPVVEGEVLEAVLTSASDPGAEIIVESQYGDVDTLEKRTAELVTDEYVTLIEGELGRIIVAAVMTVEANAGVPLSLDQRVLLEEGSTISIGFGVGFGPGIVSPIDTPPPFIRAGQKFQVRLTAGSGFYSAFTYRPSQDFYGMP